MTEERQKALLKFKGSNDFCLYRIREDFLGEVIIEPCIAEEMEFFTSSISNVKGKSAGL